MLFRFPKRRVVRRPGDFTGRLKGYPAGKPKGKRQGAKGKRVKSPLGRARRAAPKPEVVEMQWRFSDYRQEGGMMLPHRIASGPEGETTDEWEIKSYAINPPLKADKFQKK